MINCSWAHSSVILVFIYIVASQLRKEIYSKINLSWVHEQFATQIHILIYMYFKSLFGSFAAILVLDYSVGTLFTNMDLL